MSALDAASSTRPAAQTSIRDPHARGALLLADRVVTLGHGRHTGRAVLVRGKRVVWVGDDPELAPAHNVRVDLSGCTIGPAFVDSHAHLTPTGVGLAGLDVAGIDNAEDLLLAVRSYAGQHTGRVIWGHGWDPHGWHGEVPDPDRLAEAAGGLAVYLSRVDGHSCLVDRHTLSAAPLARAHGVELDAFGAPTGILRREANHIVRRWSVGAMTAHELEQARRTVARQAAAHGIASVHDMNGPDLMGSSDFDAWQFGTWPIEVVGYWGSFDLGFVADRDLRHIGGDLLLDGTLGSHTAALGQPYADRPDHTGRLEHDDDVLIELFTAATRAGVQVGVHAVGDEAMRQAVRCWQAVEAALGEHSEGAVRRLRHRIEHATVTPPDLLPSIAELGLVICAQPAFEAFFGQEDGLYETRLGAERASWTSPFRSFADLGVPIAFGSDTNVTPLDPWLAIHAAENRRNPALDFSRLESVSASALGGRYAARQERWVGTVRAGMRADLVAWEGDPFEADDPRGARAALTLVKGRVTHGHAEGLPSWRLDGEHA